MKIAHLSTEDITGGAARATYRLHTGLRRMGLDSTMFVAHRCSDDQTVAAFMRSMDFSSRVHRRLRRARIARAFGLYNRTRPPGFGIFSDDRGEHGTDVVRQIPPCDIINLHWIARFVDYEAFFSTVPQHTPVVWTLCDMNPFTGGCHVSEGCDKYKQQCGACPQLGSRDEHDLSRQIWKRKSEILSRVGPERLHIVALSRWMADAVAQVDLLNKFPLTIIPSGVDTDVYAPRDRGFAREVLGLPQEASVVLFVSHNLNIRYKGLDLLIQAMRDLNKVYLLSVGSAEKPANGLSNPYVHMGQIDNDRLLSLLYSAADLYVIPSLQDNLPSTVLESMACGTPIIGFAVGGIPDMVRQDVTGLLVPPRDVSALRAAILDLLEDRARRANMGANCRRIAVEEYALKVQAGKYAELYQSLL